MSDRRSRELDGPQLAGARVLATLTPDALAAELRLLGVPAGAAPGMAGYATGRAVRFEGLRRGVALELRERLRALGGDAAVGPSAYGEGDTVDVVLLGTAVQLETVAQRLPAADWESAPEGVEQARPPGQPARRLPAADPESEGTRDGALQGQGTLLRAAIRRALAQAEWQPGELHLGPHRLDLSRRVAVMGIVNVTPDSFYDGGRYDAPQQAIEHGLRLVAEGADLLDVGGDSAGGAAAAIDVDEEVRRVAPVVRALARQTRVPIAVDTYRAGTAGAALDAGATMVNDITGLSDPAMAPTVARGDAGLCVMHIKGRPKEFPPDFDYRSLVGDIARSLQERTTRAAAAGIGRERLVIDPGIEFGKLLYQDLELLRRLPEFRILGYPLLVAVSRKHFIGNILGLPPHDRLEGTAAAVAFTIFRGAHIVRVHDVQAMVRIARVCEALLGASHGEAAQGGQQGRRRSDNAVVE